MAPEFPDVVSWAVPFFIATLLIEAAWGRWRGGARYGTRDAAASLTMGGGNLVIGIVFGFVNLGVLMWLYELRWMDWGWTVPAIVLGFFVDDLRYYVYHRVAHLSRWWWWGHVTHHSSQHYNLSTALRQEWSGPFNLAFLLRAPLVVCLGMHPALLAFLGGINLVYQYWIHTELIRRLPAPVEWLFNTPSHHRVHHGKDARYLDANFGGTFILWDRLFGTFVPEEETPRYGLVHDVGTFNPLRLGFHELWSLVRDATQRGITVGDRLRYVFGRPGWSHDGSRETVPMIKARWLLEHPEDRGRPGLRD